MAINDKAVDDRAAEVIYLRADPIYDELSADARFTELLGRIGLPASKPRKSQSANIPSKACKDLNCMELNLQDSGS